MIATKIHPTDLVRSALIAFLTPMLLATTGGDRVQARATAIQAANAYATRNPAELLLVGESIALGLAVIDSIGLSMAENIPISLIVRLRANAVSLHRAAQQCRRGLTEAPHPTASAQDALLADADRQEAAEIIVGATRTCHRVNDDQASFPQPQAAASAAKTVPEAPTAAGQAPTPALKARSQSAPMPEDEYFNAAWAAAMSDVANEMTAEIDNLPPDERNAARIRITALNATASQLACGAQSRPR
jgi:hypothetical protein